MTYDVAVIGAGPSGSSAARLLGGRGARVVLVDPSHPREKPCGGGITGRALALADQIATIGGLRSQQVRRARFLDSASGTSAVVPLEHRGGPALVVASRTHFDGRLYEAALQSGIDVVAERAIDIGRAPHGFQVSLSSGRAVSASFIVGADGPNGLVRRRLSTAFRRDQLSVATGFFAHGQTSDEIVVEIVDDPPGYLWSFPRPDHLAIGICAQADAGTAARALRDRVARWITATGVGSGCALQSYSWPIPSLSEPDFDRLAIAGERWLTVGDAAGLVDPITREGIFFALQSAVIAADALSSAAPSREQAFVDRVRSEIVDDLRRAARFKAGFFRPRFRRLLLESLRSSAQVRTVMADLVAGNQPYRGLKRRLLRTMELRLAWGMISATYSRRAPAPADPGA